MKDIQVIHGDCIEQMQFLIDCGVQVDSIVCDPPYGLSFMGKWWDGPDTVAFKSETWQSAYELLKPGGYLLAFSGTRTYHRMACAIEDAGFEIRDCVQWIYGSGFPKSLDVSKAIDKAAGAEREIVGPSARHSGRTKADGAVGDLARYGDAGDFLTAPATDAAKQWAGWGTALKPANEPICVARKPLSEPTVAANVLKHGTGALNIDASRIPTQDDLNGGRYSDNKRGDDGNAYGSGINLRSAGDYVQPAGRWPANVIHDGSDEVLEAFAAFGESKSPDATRPKNSTRPETLNCYGAYSSEGRVIQGHGDTGTAARFFYSSKASKADRAGSKHPTVKPISLMRYLCRLVTPPGGLILDPFAGSGTTLQAAHEEGFKAIGIEREAEYYADIQRRIAALGDKPCAS